MSEFSDYYEEQGRLVPWVKGKSGEPIHTCGYDEMALDLTPLIVGWGPAGFYTQEGGRAAVEAQVAAIDWERVEYVKAHFERKMGRGGGMVLLDSPRHFITVRRYAQLLKASFKKVPYSVFQKELTAAIKTATPRKYGDGSLDE